MKLFKRKNRGATLPEYALVLGIMALVAIGGRTILTETTTSETNRNRDCVSQVPPPEECQPAQIENIQAPPPTGPPVTPPPPPTPPPGGEVPGVEPGDPFGEFEVLTGTAEPGGPKNLRVVGWAIDPDTTSPISVNIYRGTELLIQTVSADVTREDIGYPAFGSNHGFDAVIDVGTGEKNICVVAVNTGVGTNTSLGCKNLVVPTTTGNPFGNVDALVGLAPPKQLTVAGWAIDPDTTNPVTVHIYSNGKFKTSATANAVRNDVGSAYPYYGSRHGYSRTFNADTGTNQVCVYAINAGDGNTNPLLGCRTMVVPSTTGSPFGSLDTVSAAPNSITLAGWAIDPDTTEPIDVVVFVSGVNAGSFTADKTRSDVGSAHPYYGPNHGYSETITVTAGEHTVCTIGMDTNAGTNNTLLGCKTVTVPASETTK